ncbi:MAG: riboflavin kinase [Candidatus Daviesbacteria bacterium]|nr:riboflavin kinase [Candidatus Daviesbacteria bacterium]
MIIFRGKVQQGYSRGKTLGFPSANVKLHRKIPEGIYISQTKTAKKIISSLTFIGRAITFEESEYKSETYLLDFSENLYNEWISVKLIKKIRGNKKFESVDDLVKQMKEDEKVARKYFKDHV